MKREFYADRKQSNAIECLAYWISEINYISERYGVDDPEHDRVDKTICLCCFPECDRARVPFWVQNTVIAYATDWRRYVETYTRSYLIDKGIYIK